MTSVTVKVDELLDILKKNREAHRAIFLEAQKGYREEVIRRLDDMLADAREGRKITSYVQFEEPSDQTKDYDRAIRILEMSVDDEAELNDQTFRSFVMDDWSWKSNFLLSNSYYSATAASLVGE